MTKTNWRVYVRDHIYPQSISAYLDLFRTKDLSRYPYFARFYEVMSFVGAKFWWSRDLDQLEKKFRAWFGQWIASPKSFKSLVWQFSKNLKDMRLSLPRLKRELAKGTDCTDADLFDVYSRAKKHFWNNIKFSEYTEDLFDDFFDRLLYEKLKPYTRIMANPRDSVLLMKPAYVSVVQQYTRELLRLCGKRSASNHDFELILNRYDWIMMSWDGSHIITQSKIRHDYSRLKKKSYSVRRNQQEYIDRYAESVLRRRAELFAKYRLPRKILWPYFLMLDKFSMLHDWRKEGQTRCSQIVFLSLKEMSRRFNVLYRDIVYYLNHEVQSLCLLGKYVPRSVLTARQIGLTWVVRGKRFQQWTGRAAFRVVKKLVLDSVNSKKAREIQGIPASHGIVRGTVLATRSARDANRKIKKGIILVASMTTVDYVPAMHKAAAIVTDDGGLACHAAIISRELGVPCVVGTKVATRILRTGDRVEVDATRGIVKII